MRRVILSADDFGLDRAVNEAVELAYQSGVLTSASLMVGETAAADAIERARRLPGLKVGLHVALADATPVLPPEEIPALVGTDGRFPGDMVRAGFRFYFNSDARAQLAREIEAQFAAYAATGLALDHVDGHKHIQLHPTVAGLILEIGQKYGMKALRVPSEPAAPIEAISAGVTLSGRALRLWSEALRHRARRHGMVAADQMFGLVWTGAMTEARLLDLLPLLPPGTSEIYFHPATARTAGLVAAMPEYRHEEELAALLSPAVRQSLDDLAIERVSYGQLAA